MEPDRKIEKLLRAYAKKRRAEAGDSFKLHPATRRLLQGEIARRKPAVDDDETSLSLWELFRANWAVLAGFALIIFFCASFLMPVLNKAKNKAKSMEAVSSLKQIGEAAQMAAADNKGRLPATLDALTNELGSGLVLTDAVSGQRFVYVAAGDVLDNLQSNAVLAYSTGNKKGSAVLFADGSVRQVRRDEFSALTNRGSLAMAVAAVAPSSQTQSETPETSSTTIPATGMPGLADRELATIAGIKSESTTPSSGPASGNISSSGGDASVAVSHGLAAGVGSAGGGRHLILFKTRLVTNSLLFGLADSRSSAQDATAATPPVLASFELRQNGDSLLIVDRDGSIYQGTLQPSEAVEAKEKDLGVSGKPLLPAQNYLFHVAGTNRTVNQHVVFAGYLIAATDAGTNAAFHFEAGKNGASQLETTNVPPPQAISNLRITGTVTLDDTNRLEIIAVPETP